jgi:predicted phage tail protein
MILNPFKRRLNKREKTIVKVCCEQTHDSMKKRLAEGTAAEIEIEILPELKKIIRKL